MDVSLRYCAKNSTYYLQVQGAQYAQLEKKLRRIKTCMEHTSKDKHSEEKNRLNEYRKRLLQEKRQSQYYIIVSASDIPKNMYARPIYDLPGQIVTVNPKRYAQLLDRVKTMRDEGSAL